MGRLIAFIKYNNALPIAVALIMLSATGALAANEDVQKAFVNSEKKITSVDNSYIRNVDLDTFTPQMRILNVTEDDDRYYVDYRMVTIGIDNGVWKDVVKSGRLKVAKKALGDDDLGLYVTKELKELVDREVAVLRETQQLERNVGEKPKIVATAYSGLVGKYLDPKEERIEGYEPVKPPAPEPKPPKVGEENGGSSNTSGTSSGGGSTTKSVNTRGLTTTIVSNPQNGDTEPPRLQVLGNNPARIERGANWRDLGAYVTDNKNPNIGYSTGGLEEVDVDTPGEYFVKYTAKDQAGNTTTITRIVIIYDPAEPNAIQPSFNPISDSSTVVTATIPEEESSSTETQNGTSSTNDATTSGSGSTSDTDTDSPTSTSTATSTSDGSSTVGTDTASSTDATTGGTDESTQESTATSTEATVDTTAPTITLNGSTSVTIQVGDTYTDAGASATDDTDGDLTDSIVVTGSVDTQTAGTYTLSYNVADAAGNSADEVVRTVVVEEPPAQEETATSTPSGTEATTGETSTTTATSTSSS